MTTIPEEHLEKIRRLGISIEIISNDYTPTDPDEVVYWRLKNVDVLDVKGFNIPSSYLYQQIGLLKTQMQSQIDALEARVADLEGNP